MIEINGIKYKKNEPKQKQSSYASRRMLGIAAIAAACDPYGGYIGYGGSSYSRPRPAVDIVKEYELIQNKQSKLSKSDRDWVVRVFEANYTKIE